MFVASEIHVKCMGAFEQTVKTVLSKQYRFKVLFSRTGTRFKVVLAAPMLLEALKQYSEKLNENKDVIINFIYLFTKPCPGYYSFTQQKISQLQIKPLTC